MGYRSEVIIYVEETNGICLENIISDIKKIEDCSDSMEISRNSENNRVLKVHYDWVKWYDEYDLVKYWNNLFDKLDEDNCKFARMGENDSDFETYGSYGYIYLNRIFDIDVDFDEKKAISI